MIVMRVFIAITLSEQIRSGLCNTTAAVRKIDSGIKWVRPENIHLTLKFLGDVKENSVDDIIDAMNHAADNQAKFELSIGGAGAFPNLKRPKVMWVGINKGKSQMIDLASQVDFHLSQLGFEKEKRQFSPHITLGRVKYLKNIDQVTNQFSDLFKHNEAMIVENIQLIQSVLNPSGAEYTPLHITQLKDG